MTPRGRRSHLRGSYAGLAHYSRRRVPARSSGSRRWSCSPCTQFAHDHHFLRKKGLQATTGGTTSVGYFAHRITEYASTGVSTGQQVHRVQGRWCKTRSIAAGIEVILDVVYNHTAEGNHLGPLSFRGIDNATPTTAWIRTTQPVLSTTPGPATASTCVHPHVAAADHGFAALLGDRDARRRFPLRPRLRPWPESCTTSTGSRRSSTSSTRTRCSRRSSSSPSPGTSARAATRSATSLRPVEPSGTASTATLVRDFWRGSDRRSASSASASPAAATCMGQRPPPEALRSINFVTCPRRLHLRDLVSYNQKHNEANLEDNRDGTQTHNRSRGTAASRGPPTIRRSISAPPQRSAQHDGWRPCCSRRACR